MSNISGGLDASATGAALQKLVVKYAVLASFLSNPLIAIKSPSTASREGDA